MPPDTTILTAEELAGIRRDYRSAHLLPKRAYQDATIHALAVRPDQSPCGPCYTYPP